MIKRYIPSHSVFDVIRLSISTKTHNKNLKPLFEISERVFPVSSATDGLILSLKVLVGGKGKVALSAYTCLKVPDALSSAGFEPVFIDIDPSSGLAPSSALERFLPGDLVAIIATHMFGVPCDIEGYQNQAKRLDAILIEDCALAQGTKHQGKHVGTFAPIAIFSFGRGKSLNFGGGGALVVNDIDMSYLISKYISDFSPQSVLSDLILKIKLVIKLALMSKEPWSVYFPIITRLKRVFHRTWFWEQKIISAGYNVSCNTYNRCNMLYLRMLENSNAKNIFEHKKLIASIYRRNIKSSINVKHLSYTTCCADIVMPSYPLIVSNRERFFGFLRINCIDCGLSFSYSAANVYGNNTCQGSLDLSRNIITLPIHEDISELKAKEIVNVINSWENE